MPSPRLTIFQNPAWQKEAAFVHGFFGRTGGLSLSVNKSLNCSYQTEDIDEYVATNRRTALHAFQSDPSHLCLVNQCHSAKVLVADRPFPPLDSPAADGLVTTTPSLFIGVLTADCAPVLFADSQRGVVGAAHAGWRGAFADIVEETVRSMEASGSRRPDIEAVIGPCIHQPSYEVSEEFRSRFCDKDSAFAAFFKPVKPSHYLFNLSGFIARKLKQAEIGKSYRIPFDTYKETDKLFSHRLSTQTTGRTSGRQLSLIGLK